MLYHGWTLKTCSVKKAARGHILWVHLYEMFKGDKTLETKQVSSCHGLGGGELGSDTNGIGFLFRIIKRFKLVMLFAQFCDYTNTHWLKVNFTYVNFISSSYLKRKITGNFNKKFSKLKFILHYFPGFEGKLFQNGQHPLNAANCA